jgi:peptidoglycan/LPS O-acetylase OafA/YrhL
MARTVDDVAVGPARVVRSPSLGYHPALDGLRGLALLAIIAYHSQVGWAPGAFLSVSTFFTLSGFLITSLLLIERTRSGRISLGGFWARRLRRLMPAALTAIFAIVVATWILGDSTQLSRLRSDALSALGYVANWHFIAAGDKYGAGFASPSPFTHFWTLAIEEQFYIVLPPLTAGVLLLTRGSRRTLAWVYAGIIAASLAWSQVLLHHGVSLDRLYWGTDVRVVEFLVGSMLALVFVTWPEPLAGRARRGANVLGTGALAAMLVLWATAGFENRTVYSGGLAAYSLLTAAVIFAALQPGSVPQRVLAWRPLAWIGLVSYGAYLVHFPILIWLASHTGLRPAQRLALALPLTLVVAGLSARFLERPIRSRRRLAGPRTWLAASTAVAVTAASIFTVTTIAGAGPGDQLANVSAIFQRDLAKLRPAIVGSHAPRVATYGDSTALMAGLGVLEYSIGHPKQVVAERGWAQLGCGLLGNVKRRVQGQVVSPPAMCKDWLAGWKADVAANPVDIAVVELGTYEVTDQQLGGHGPFLTIGKDAALDNAFRRALQQGVDTLLAHARIVVLLSSPNVDVGRVDGRSPNTAYPESDPARMERFRQMLDDVAARSSRVKVLDYAGWLAHRPDEHHLRPDGVHLTASTTGTVAAWLVPQLLRAYHDATGRDTTQVTQP